MSARTKEVQYEDCLRLAEEVGIARFGVMSNQVWHDDPKRLAFVLARYKFVAKMLSGADAVLEIGCADAFATRIVQQEVGRIHAIDIDPVFIADVRERMSPDWPLEAAVHDLLTAPYGDGFDAAYSLDVLEHIPATDEDRFVANAAASLGPHGVLIVGMPSLSSQDHASPQSRVGHINCKHAPELEALMRRHFHNVFIFSMNDEVVHTGFWPMAHYYLALCCAKRAA
ncbi:MAG: class I SAM-dependent methyltransferase [Alphaproteobacteria bacterium]|jgi:2-polyprenyl-3-methyl-5-hydroxy-6-metoxy-1,4-benzoquinol methylase|nr:class I SAM-dependent methyltransferase [Alphaproteobacteria bacterium]